MYKIEIMDIKDYKEIITLWKNSEGIGLNDFDDSKRGIKKFLERNPKTCFVVKDNKNGIIGTVMGGNDGRRGIIYHLFVKSEYRRNKIGKKLLEKVEKSLKKEGIKRMYLIVLKENKIGNIFWQNNGYIVRDFIKFRSKIISE